MSKEELYKPESEGNAVRDLVTELGLFLTDEQIARLSVQQILGIADGSLRINRNPSAPTGQVHEWVGSTEIPPNGHDYI